MSFIKLVPWKFCENSFKARRELKNTQKQGLSLFIIKHSGLHYGAKRKYKWKRVYVFYNVYICPSFLEAQYLRTEISIMYTSFRDTRYPVL